MRGERHVEQPALTTDKIRRQSRPVGRLHGPIFSGGLGELESGCIAHCGCRFVEASFPVGHQLPGHQNLPARQHGTEETHIQLGAIGETPGLRGAGPNHDFVQHGGDDSAMHYALEAGVFGARQKLRPHQSPIGLEAQVEAERIGFAADETRAGVGQWLHGC